ncbi:hypothetical protein Tcan_10978, partial [Toxocara canis]
FDTSGSVPTEGIVELLVRCALCLSSVTVSGMCVFYLTKTAVSRASPKRAGSNESRMRISIADLPNASRPEPSFRSRSPSFGPVFRDMRNHELDVQHIVLGLLKRARKERDDPKFVEAEDKATASKPEEQSSLLTAISVESELSSEEEFERDNSFESDYASGSAAESVDESIHNISGQSSSRSLTVHRCSSGRWYPKAQSVESVYLSPLMQSEMRFRVKGEAAGCMQ